MEKTNIKVLCFTDTEDNTKGTIFALNENTETRSDEMAKMIDEALTERDFFSNSDPNFDPIVAHECARQIAYLGMGSFNEYEFYFEVIPLIKP